MIARIHAPPMGPEKLLVYKDFARKAQGPVGELMRRLTGEAILKGMELIREDEYRSSLSVFDALPAGPTKDAAFHLLWFARERQLGRKPVTSDMV